MKKLLLASAVLLTATPALAHHPLAGMPMETFTHGLLSGIGHPVLGFDHLFFVLAVGIAAAFTGAALRAPAAYIAAMLAGCWLMSIGFGLPATELVIGASLIAVGAVVASGKGLSILPALGLFAVFGLFHGSAFGESLAAHEAGAGGAVMIGYLLGLGLIQYAIAVGAGWAVSKLFGAADAGAIQARLSGSVVAGVGIFLTLENVEGIVFDMMGWAV